MPWVTISNEQFSVVPPGICFISLTLFHHCIDSTACSKAAVLTAASSRVAVHVSHVELGQVWQGLGDRTPPHILLPRYCLLSEDVTPWVKITALN